MTFQKVRIEENQRRDTALYTCIILLYVVRNENTAMVHEYMNIKTIRLTG